LPDAEDDFNQGIHRVPEGGDCITDKEFNRRLKISAANKGRVPWNKGIEHSEEVRAKIRQRTFEAMQRPDVRARMVKANQSRPPHRDEVKERIRTVLRQRAQVARAIIREQAVLVVDAMQRSSDEKERNAGKESDAENIVGRLAWRYLKRDFEKTYERWEADEGGFKRIVVARIQELSERKRNRQSSKSTTTGKGRPRKSVPGSKTPAGKLRAAVATQKKLLVARKKVDEAEAVLGKLDEVKAVYAERGPEASALVLLKEEQTRAVLEKLKAQVAELTEAMAPLQEYLAPGTAAMDFVVQQQEQHQLEQKQSGNAGNSSGRMLQNGNAKTAVSCTLVNGVGASASDIESGDTAVVAAGSSSRLRWRQ